MLMKHVRWSFRFSKNDNKAKNKLETFHLELFDFYRRIEML